VRTNDPRLDIRTYLSDILSKLQFSFRANAAPVLLGGLLLFFNWAGMRGADVPLEWDEKFSTVWSVRFSVENNTLLPHLYYYPSLLLYVGFVALAPEFVNYELHQNKTGFSKFLYNQLDYHSLLIRLRHASVFISSLTLLWIYLAVLAWRRNPWEALLAACLIGMCPEFCDLARRFRSDALMTQCGAMTLLFLILSETTREPNRWIRWAAFGSGLAAGAKYPGAALLFPVLLSAHRRNIRSGLNVWQTLRPLAIVAGIFSITYLATTPGTILDKSKFIQDVCLVQSIYAHGWHYSEYRTETGWPHLSLIAQFLFLSAFSRSVWISFFMAIMSLIGLLSSFREDKYLFGILLSFPLIYIATFIFQVYMIPRNYIVLLPFSAIFAARGCFFSFQSLQSHPILRFLMMSAILFSVVENTHWLYVG